MAQIGLLPGENIIAVLPGGLVSSGMNPNIGNTAQKASTPTMATPNNTPVMPGTSVIRNSNPAGGGAIGALSNDMLSSAVINQLASFAAAAQSNNSGSNLPIIGGGGGGFNSVSRSTLSPTGIVGGGTKFYG